MQKQSSGYRQAPFRLSTFFFFSDDRHETDSINVDADVAAVAFSNWAIEDPA